MMRSSVLARRVVMPAVAASRKQAFGFPMQRRCLFTQTAPMFARRDLPRNTDTDLQHTQQPESGEVQETKQSEYDALTPHARKYLTRVYGNTAAGMFTAGAGTAMMLFTPLGATIPMWAPAIASFVPLVLLGTGMVQSQPARLATYHAFASLLGAGAAGAVGVAAVKGVLMPAVALTGATFAGFSAAAMMAPKGSAMKMQGPLMAGMFGLIAINLFSLFVAPTPLVQQLTMYAGLAIFSLFIAADTSTMIEKANQGAEDIVGDSINMLLNIVQTFSYIVRILTGGSDD